MRILWRTNIIKFKKLGLKKVQGKYKYFNTSTVLQVCEEAELIVSFPM